MFEKCIYLKNGESLISIDDFTGIFGICSECGSYVAKYHCNQDLMSKIGITEEQAGDWYASCVNEHCKNHYGGAGIMDFDPDFLIDDFSLCKYKVVLPNMRVLSSFII